MAKKKFDVIADFKDKETGKTIKAGTVFEVDEERETALRKAKVIGEEKPKRKAGDADAKTDRRANRGTGDAGGSESASEA